MKLYKVQTLVQLDIKTKWFWIKKQTSAWFITNIKFIYADCENTARAKYKELFFNSVANVISNKCMLECYEWLADSYSDNMKFKLSFNQCVDNIKETIDVDTNNVHENIDYIKSRMSADDFRDWLMNGTYEVNSIYDLDWIDK